MKYIKVINYYGDISSFYGDIHNKNLLIIFSCFAILIYFFYALNLPPGHTLGKLFYSATNESKKYLIKTSKCKIADLDPLNAEVLKFFVKKKYVPCNEFGLLSYIQRINDVPYLKINNSLISLYSWWEISCCYSNVTRAKNNDDSVLYSECVAFENSVRIYSPIVRVTCKNFFKNIYVNVHAVTLPVEINQYKENEENFSVILVGIDSMSKQNLRRTMPETYQYLQKNFLNLKGYNKIADNTFPNIMAILSGQSDEQLEESCNPKGNSDNCSFIWKDFKQSGYVTAYAEDESGIATFNYRRPGFVKPPTDYYYRPYVIAAEKISVKLLSHMNYCSGPESSGERILNAAKDYAITHRNVGSFGLFWTSSFSHDDINVPSSMDEKVLEFLQDPNLNKALNRTFLIFFSDHGFRFGSIRYTHAGWLEERLPYFYIRVPETFKQFHPDKLNNLIINAHRLTTPYDVFKTLGHVLELANSSYVAQSSSACPNCHSLFEEIAENRTCKDAAIEQHWCTCADHTYINPKVSSVHSIAEFVIKELNKLKNSFAEGGECRDFQLSEVTSAGLADLDYTKNEGMNSYMVISFRTVPDAKFEATVDISKLEQEEFKLLGDISRIDRYDKNSRCVHHAVLRKYCYCYQGIYKFKKKICDAVNC